MKTNFNDQKGKPNGKGKKNRASDTVEKNKTTEQNITGHNREGNDPGKNDPTRITPDNDPRKNDPTRIPENDPWKEPTTVDSNRENRTDQNKNEYNRTTNNNNPLKNDPNRKTPENKSSVTDPTIDENIVNDSLF